MNHNHGAIIEEIIHITCGHCKNVWSVATMDHFRPSAMSCPFCSELGWINLVEVPHANTVKDTGTVKGRGVFAGRAYYEGEVVEVSPVVALEGEVPDCVSKYCYQWQDGCAMALGQGTLFNHANPANLRYKQDHDNLVIKFFAARRIAKGEELTINYNSDGEPECSDNNYFEYHKITPV